MLGNVQVTAVLGQRSGLRIARYELLRAQSGDLGAHHRPIDEVEAQHAQAIVVSGDLEVSVEEAMRKIRPAAVAKVHHRERNLAHDVDPAHLFVEFDAIEDRELAVAVRDVAKVQVAVTFAHETFAAASRHRPRAKGVLARRPRGKRIEVGGLCVGIRQQPHLGEVLQRNAKHVFRDAEGSADAGDARRAVECGDLGRQGCDVCRGQFAAGERPACQCLLRELPHPHCVFDGRPVAPEHGRLGAAPHADDVEIERWRQTTVEPQFFFAIEAASVKAAEVQETQRDGLLDFVGESPGQKDVGNMRFDQGDVLTVRTRNRGIPQ